VNALPRLLIFAGALLIFLGLLLWGTSRLPWLGRLPGDLLIQRGRFTLYLPLGTCLALSLLLGLWRWLANRFR